MSMNMSLSKERNSKNECILFALFRKNSKRKAMNRNWNNEKANPALKTKMGKNRQNIMRTNC